MLLRSRFRSYIFAVSPALVARTGLGVMAALIVPGVLAETSSRDNVFELDNDRTLAALVSAAIMLGAAAAAAAWAFRRQRFERAPLGLAALFVGAAAHEWIGLHYEVEALFGVSWELVYAPIAAAGAALALATLRSMRGQLERRMMVAGGLLWLLAQGLDHRGVIGSELVDDVFQGAEEIAEMAGSLLFWLSFAYAAERLEKRRAALREVRASSSFTS